MASHTAPDAPVEIHVSAIAVDQRLHALAARAQAIVERLAAEGIVLNGDGGCKQRKYPCASLTNKNDMFNLDSVAQAMQHIETLISVPSKTRRARWTSFNGKHWCEKLLHPHRYITNGDFILAMELCGHRSHWPDRIMSSSCLFRARPLACAGDSAYDKLSRHADRERMRQANNIFAFESQEQSALFAARTVAP